MRIHGTNKVNASTHREKSMICKNANIVFFSLSFQWKLLRWKVAKSVTLTLRLVISYISCDMSLLVFFPCHANRKKKSFNGGWHTYRKWWWHFARHFSAQTQSEINYFIIIRYYTPKVRILHRWNGYCHCHPMKIGVDRNAWLARSFDKLIFNFNFD